jgi:hypothetical protein
MAVAQSSRDDMSSVPLRLEAPFKTTFSNHVSVKARQDSGKPLRKPAGSMFALVFEGFLCLIALCFIGTNLTSKRPSHTTSLITEYGHLALALVALCIRNRPTGDSLGSAMEQVMRLVRIW